MGWVGDSSVRLHSRVSGGGQCPARETGGKNSPGPPTLSALSQAGPWAWLQELFWCLGELHSLEEGPLSALPHPPFSLPEAAGHCGSLPSRQRKEGRAETEGGRRWRRVRRAGPPMMPKVPDPETASGRSSASALVTEPVAQPEPTRLALCSVASSMDTQAITHLISESPAATSASSGGPTHKKACLLWTI